MQKLLAQFEQSDRKLGQLSKCIAGHQFFSLYVIYYLLLSFEQQQLLHEHIHLIRILIKLYLYFSLLPVVLPAYLHLKLHLLREGMQDIEDELSELLLVTEAFLRFAVKG